MIPYLRIKPPNKIVRVRTFFNKNILMKGKFICGRKLVVKKQVGTIPDLWREMKLLTQPTLVVHSPFGTFGLVSDHDVHSRLWFVSLKRLRWQTLLVQVARRKDFPDDQTNNGFDRKYTCYKFQHSVFKLKNSINLKFVYNLLLYSYS